MAGTTVIAAKLTLDGSQPAQSVRSFKAQLREAQVDLLAMQQSFGDLSPEAITAARNVAALRDRVQEAREVADLFDPGKKFQAFAGALSTVAAGYGAVQGAMGLFGAESKELEKQLLKVQSAMALAQGLSAIADGAKDFQRLGLVAKEALSGIRTGLLATGIGAFVVLLGTVVAYWDDIKEAVSGVSSEQKKALDVATKANEKEKEKLDHLDDQDNILKMQGKSEKQILELKEAQVQEVINAGEAQLEAQKAADKAAIAAAERNKMILTTILQLISAPLQAITQGIDAIGEKFGKTFGTNAALNKGIDSVASMIFDPKGMKEEADKSYKEQEQGLTKLRNQYAGYQLQIKEINKAAAEKEREFQKQLRDIRNQADNVFVKDAALLAKEKLEQDNRNAVESINAQQISQKQRHELLLEQERLYNNQLTDLTNEAESAKFLAETEASQKKIDAKKAEINGLLAWQIQANAQLTEDENNNAEARKQIAQIELEHKYATMAAIGQILLTGSQMLGESTAAGKVFAVAAASIDTFAAISKTLRAFSGIPIPGYAIAQAIATGLVGLANVRKIIAVQVPGKGVGGSAPSISMSGSVAAPLTPRPEVVNTALPQDQIDRLGNAAVRAYVIESDVTNSQEKITRVNRQARLGG